MHEDFQVAFVFPDVVGWGEGGKGEFREGEEVEGGEGGAGVLERRLEREDLVVVLGTGGVEGRGLGAGTVMAVWAGSGLELAFESGRRHEGRRRVASRRAQS